MSTSYLLGQITGYVIIIVAAVWVVRRVLGKKSEITEEESIRE